MPSQFVRPEISYEWPIAPNVRERFYSYFIEGEESECWLWLAACRKEGYGSIRNGRCMTRAHRLSWVIHNERPVPTGMHVLHTCDVRACVNPSHLYIGTNADNIADKVRRGRSSWPRPERRLEGHPLAKLTHEKVAEMRSMATGRRGEGVELAAHFGVSRATVCRVLKGQLW